MRYNIILCTAAYSRHFFEGVTLHPREREILTAILKNQKRRDIAEQMNLSENTVKTYTRSLYRELVVTSREELYELV